MWRGSMGKGFETHKQVKEIGMICDSLKLGSCCLS